VASEQVHEVLVHRHVFDSERPFSPVLDGIFVTAAVTAVALILTLTDRHRAARMHAYQRDHWHHER
jgi:hypothetical protein